MDIKEKRVLERFDLKIPARIEVMAPVQDHLDNEIPNLLTSDICSGGAYFHTGEPLPKGIEVKIDLMLPLDTLQKIKSEWKHAHIQVTGKVLRSESKGMAISFDKDYRMGPWKGNQ